MSSRVKKGARSTKAALEQRQRELAQAIYGYCLSHDELVTEAHGQRTRWWIDGAGELCHEPTTKPPTGGGGV